MKYKEIDEIFNFGILPEPNPYGSTLTVKKHNQLLRKMKLETEAFISTIRSDLFKDILEKMPKDRELEYAIQQDKSDFSDGWYSTKQAIAYTLDHVTSLINNLIEEK